MAELIITLPTGKVLRQPLTLKPQDVGRDPGCHIQIDDATVSRRHADLRGEANGRFLIRDLGSKNGTLVNNDPVTTRVLKDGDLIVFGSVAARFSEHDTPPSGNQVTVDEGATIAPDSVSYIGPQDKIHLSQKRLEMLYDISDRLTGLRHREELLADIMKICIDTFGFERAAIGVRRPNRRGMDWPQVHNMRGADGEIKLSRTILQQSLEEGKRVIISDASRDLIDPTVSIVQQGTRSAMCVPIAYSEEILGVIYGDRISTTRRYEQEDVDFLAALARQVSIGLTNARLMAEHEEKVYLQKEIAIARQIQSDLFPDTVEVHPRLDIAAVNEPGRQVSGDYYDVIRMSDGSVGIVIADVTGKGVASALIAANMQAAIRVLMPETSDLGVLGRRLNQLIYTNTASGRFITAIIAVVDPIQRVLRFISAGHYPPIVKAGPRTTEVHSEHTSLPFGVEADAAYESVTIDLGPDPVTLFFYTDGLNEALDENENEYGTERILQTLAADPETDPARVLDLMRRSVANFCGTTPQRDDITLIAVRAR